MLSLDLLDRFITRDARDGDLLSHLIASHHGYARPLAPVCLDDARPGFRLDEFGCKAVSHEERDSWSPAHRLDSGIAERFWSLNRQFGWWGLAWLESTLRLADWNASANPGRGNSSSLSFAPVDAPRKTKPKRELLVLNGIDGSKPLGFLAALGVFRTLEKHPEGSGYSFGWTQTSGAWRPTVFSIGDSSLSHEWLLDALMEHLETDADRFLALRIAELDCDRRDMFQQIATASHASRRDDADWLSCNGSDIVGPEAISQLQTTRRDYHSIGIRGLLSETKVDHLRRSLFEPWDYSDPIAGVSLHLEPREDRRHAYQWFTPSGDPTRKLYGGMIGANRLALEAWPLFQSLPASDKLATVGFQGLKANNTKLTWPIWTTPIPISVVATVLSLRSLQQPDIAHKDVNPVGITHVYRCSRILVGKTPNLTSASPAMA
jgi:CRISPR-associated endonuclease/helicase Cas3